MSRKEPKKLNTKLLEKTWTFEKIQGNPKISRIVSILILTVALSVAFFDLVNSKRIDLPTLIMLAIPVLLWFFPDKKLFQQVVCEKNGVTVSFGRVKGKINATYFSWNQLSVINKGFDKNGFPYWITFKGDNGKTASVLFHSFGKDLKCLLKQYSTHHDFQMHGFDVSETTFDEFDRTIPEYKNILEFMS